MHRQEDFIIEYEQLHDVLHLLYKMHLRKIYTIELIKENIKSVLTYG